MQNRPYPIINQFNKKYRDRQFNPISKNDRESFIKYKYRTELVISGNNNGRLEKEYILNKFNIKDVEELRKRQKFSQYVEVVTNEGDEAEPIPVCSLFDTGFEHDCDYTSRLYLLGEYIILENFESRTTNDIGGEIFNVSNFKLMEDFEYTLISEIELIDFRR
jgi:hypothetical protein